ncbi:MAG: sodium:solute symporter family protein [Saprospiraceae bacterium]|nr:sodium:solute symporter family protein [Saprospiraceae bacterium]
MNSIVFLTCFFLYILGMIALSVFISRKQKSGEDFLLGNRSVPFLLTLGTTVATMVGTGSSMGAIGKGYADGWAGSLYGIGGAIGILLLAKWFGPARKHRFMTFAEELSFYYGANKKIKAFMAVLILLAEIGWLGAHILGGGLYLSWIAGIDLLQAKIIVALAFSIYVIIGGYMAVVWTDTIQAIVLFFGFILLAYISLDEVGGISGLNAAHPHETFAFLTGPNLIPSLSLAFVIFIGVMATPAYRQRIYSADSIQNIRKSFYLSGVLYLFFCFIPAIIGMSAYQLNPGLENSNYAFPYLATEVLPLAIGMIVLIAGLSATMSSASSDAIAGVSILLRDIYQLFTGSLPDRSQAIKLSRLGLIFISGLALIFSLYATDIIDYIKYMISVIMSGMFVAVMLGKYWSRATWQGGIATLLGGAICSIIVINVESWDTFWGNPAIPACFAALFFGVLVSLLTPPNKVSAAKALEILSTERMTMEGQSHSPPA